MKEKEQLSDQEKSNVVIDGIKVFGNRTRKEFSKVFNVSESNLNELTKIESEIFNLFIFDVVLHKKPLKSEFRQLYLFSAMDTIEDKYGNNLSNENLTDLINERFNQYADLPNRGQDWPRFANKMLVINLKGSVNTNSMQKNYPIIPEDVTQSMMNNLQFAQLKAEDFEKVMEIVDKMYDTGKKKGCYVATMVYGDYSHPNVVELRKFRDNSLDKTYFGKLFIRIYYRFSPILVQKIENKSSINKLIKKLLDRIVDKLKKNKNVW